MLKCLLGSSGWQRNFIRSKSMFEGRFANAGLVKDSTKTNILYLNASHSPQSLVAIGAKVLLDNLVREKQIHEVDLWKDKLVQYRLEHAVSKLKILRGTGSKEDEDRFAPVLAAAESINQMDIVVVATPMWNFSIPYVLKQYIDTIVQPGINFNDSDNPALTKNDGRILVVISSAGADYPEDAEIKDFLNPYLKQIFGLMGFTKFYPIFIQGTATTEKKESILWTEHEARKCASTISKILDDGRL